MMIGRKVIMPFSTSPHCCSNLKEQYLVWVMYNRRQLRAVPDTNYASQADRWKKGFKLQMQESAQQQTDLENALVSELCSSVGSSSFPPRDVLQKLLRYLHTLDNDYICELLDDKFENPLWQVKAKALSVLSALLSSSDADFYKQYYSGRLDLFEDLRNARKDMLRKRADKVFVLLRDCIPPDEGTPMNLMQEMQQEEAEEAEAGECTLMQTSPVVTSQPTPHDLMMGMNSSPRSSSAPLPTPSIQNESFFGFLVQQHQQDAPTLMAAEPITPPVSNSAFGFLSENGGEVDLPQTMSLESTNPLPSAPSLSSESSNFSFMNQISPDTSVHASTSETSLLSMAATPSAFAFLDGQQRLPQQQKSVFGAAKAQASRRSTVFDTSPQPMMIQFSESAFEIDQEKKRVSDPIHDAFEGMDANDGTQALQAFDAYKPSSYASHGRCEDDGVQAIQSTEPLREVILEIEVPPGPMGVMLDRTIPDMTVIERFVPLPLGGRGYLELHPAICPGCALISINSIYVEKKGLAEVGPILGSLVDAPKLLRFKKLMTQGRTANPSTLEVPYIPPPLEDEEVTAVNKANESTKLESEEDTYAAEVVSGEKFMTQLNRYNCGLAEVEAKLNQFIGCEHSGQLIGDRRNQLAQLHGTVEKIQTQGIDSVIFGERRPSNYEEVKQFRLTLVRKADELARLIQSIASTEVDSPYESVTALDEEKHPASAFAFVKEDVSHQANVPPFSISQQFNESGFRFLNANANPQVADVYGEKIMVPPPISEQADSSYGFSFLRDSPKQQPAISKDTTNILPNFDRLLTDNANLAENVTNVFAGLNLKESTQHQQPIFAGLSLKNNNQQESTRLAPTLHDSMTKSSHGRPMGLRDLEASLRSTASIQPTTGAPFTDRGPIGSERTDPSFAFISAARYDSSLTSTQPTSPTAFGFMRGSNTSSTTPTEASSTISHSHSVLQEPEPSMFSFISN
ncbi:hypothetical protein CCR75_007672 [Bremia lactucae]|uniref:VHS domain-containing protein n=1 Tax=Bremia lactucae TaxID=4779 RepID=A0A976IKM8_BRELC|nr:hypothetical protein CCR75_007672 [Bremia lactucae]